MKTTLLLTFSLAALLPLGAVPKPEAAPEAAPAPPADVDVEVAEEAAPKEGKRPGFLGVRAQAVGPAHAEQLELNHGVTLLSVEPGTPAAKAGLKMNDIITEVGETKVGSMLELRDAILEYKEGDEVVLKLVQEGKRVEKKVTLAAAPVVPRMILPQAGIRIVPGGGLQGGGMRWNFEAAGQFRIGDQDGSVEMKGAGERREVTVRDHRGEIAYEGPWVTPQDKAAPATHIRKRIERVANMWGGAGLPFQRGFAIPPELDIEIPVPDLLVPEDEVDDDFGDGFGKKKGEAPKADKEAPAEDEPAEEAPKEGGK